MIQIPAYLTGFSSLSDGGASIRFSTQELSPEDFALLKGNHNAFGYLLFAPNKFTEEDLPKEQAEDKNKTPSKRLRATLFILWKQEGEQGDFEAFYRSKMEKLIEMVKAKLD